MIGVSLAVGVDQMYAFVICYIATVFLLFGYGVYCLADWIMRRLHENHKR